MLAYCSRSDVVDLVADTQLCEEDSDLINQAGQTESLALQSVSLANFPPTVPGTLTARNLFTCVTFWSSMLFLFQAQLKVPEKVILFVGCAVVGPTVVVLQLLHRGVREKSTCACCTIVLIPLLKS